jgi:hypothetical protein
MSDVPSGNMLRNCAAPIRDWFRMRFVDLCNFLGVSIGLFREGGLEVSLNHLSFSNGLFKFEVEPTVRDKFLAHIRFGAVQTTSMLYFAWQVGRLRAVVRVTSRAVWIDQGRLLEQLHKAVEGAVMRLPVDASLVAVERCAADALRRTCKQYNSRRPEVIVLVHEYDPRSASSNFTMKHDKGSCNGGV